MEEYAVFYPPNGMNYTIASSSGSLERFFFSQIHNILFFYYKLYFAITL